MNKIKKTIAIILIIIFFPILIVNIILIVKSYKNKDKVPDFLGYKPFIVLSGSMEPAIGTGDVVVVKNVEQKELEIGDIIVFREKDATIIHRIIEIKEENQEKYFTTKGDNNNKEDSYITDGNDIEGRYIFRIKKIGKIAMFLQSPLGTIIFIIISFLIFTNILVSTKLKKEVNRNE